MTKQFTPDFPRLPLESKHQDNEEKVGASGWTEEQILTKGDKFTTPYTEGVQTYDPVGLTNQEKHQMLLYNFLKWIDGEEQADG